MSYLYKHNTFLFPNILNIIERLIQTSSKLLLGIE